MHILMRMLQKLEVQMTLIHKKAAVEMDCEYIIYLLDWNELLLSLFRIMRKEAWI